MYPKKFNFVNVIIYDIGIEKDWFKERYMYLLLDNENSTYATLSGHLSNTWTLVS